MILTFLSFEGDEGRQFTLIHFFTVDSFIKNQKFLYHYLYSHIQFSKCQILEGSSVIFLHFGGGDFFFSGLLFCHFIELGIKKSINNPVRRKTIYFQLFQGWDDFYELLLLVRTITSNGSGKIKLTNGLCSKYI